MKKIVSLFMAFTVLLSLSACGGLSLKPDENKSDSKEGYIGDTLSTYWFDFTVNDAYISYDYEGYTPEAGNKLVVAKLTLKNRMNFSLDMWQGDFPILWDDEENGLEYPISAFTDDQLPDEYTLGINQSKSGLLVYVVPEDYRDFTIAFLEIFEDEDNEDGRDGDVYFIDFTPEEK